MIATQDSDVLFRFLILKCDLTVLVFLSRSAKLPFFCLNFNRNLVNKPCVRFIKGLRRKIGLLSSAGFRDIFMR